VGLESMTLKQLLNNSLLTTLLYKEQVWIYCN